MIIGIHHTWITLFIFIIASFQLVTTMLDNIKDLSTPVWKDICQVRP